MTVSVKTGTDANLAPELLEAAKLVIARWEKGDLAEAVRQLSAAIESTEQNKPSEDSNPSLGDQYVVGSDDCWAENETYTVADWQHEVANGDTRRGYWEWVQAQIEDDAA